ncbi:Uma2 family endonuclease [Labedaea rhizosphaerae]|uniref:Uma2 family endonuclease n=1 Tax=Labedaea rhizosphaerae TaxID=598644 RepID=A0A4R6S9Y7_LABRH|nr:Uma2 family endonuclease [Labedaea rhizosphaerae]TDP96294.1 Uma2 family endonuclease [Labedaea rhizosphaerae]
MFTVDDLATMPDDGRRYELIDGMLVVSPLPGFRHQKAVMKLLVALEMSCPDDVEVLVGPFAVRPSPTLELRPDGLAARRSDLTEDCLPVAPLLAVEVLSHSSAINDLNNKKAVYERLGVPSYWVVDPGPPSLVAFDLVDGAYRLTTEVQEDEVFEATQPFPVRIVLAELLGQARE